MLYFLLPRSFRKWVRLLRNEEPSAVGLLNKIQAIFTDYNRDVANVHSSALPPASRIDVLRAKESVFNMALLNLNTPVLQAQLRGDPDTPGQLTHDDKLDILNELEASDIARRKLLMNRVLRKSGRQSQV